MYGRAGPGTRLTVYSDMTVTGAQGLVIALGTHPRDFH